MSEGLVLRTDGAARGNPGPAGAGVVIEDADGAVLREVEHYLGSRTNNQAEYEALVLGLRSLLDDPPRKGAAVTACLDSELVVRQLAGRYRDGKLPLAQALEAANEPGSFVWIGLHEPSHEEFQAVREEFGLHELAVEDAVSAHQRPKLEVYEGDLFVVLKTARYDDLSETVEFAELQIFVGDR